MTEQDATNSNAVNTENIGASCGDFKTRSAWFKCFPEDYMRATRGLTPEQRGIYFDCLCILYETEKPLPDDDKWMAHQLHVSSRLWRSVRDALVACGKLTKVAGGFVNARAQVELESRSNQRRTNAEIASNRERTKRENPRNENKNNKTGARNQHHVRARQIPDTEDRIEKRESIASTVPEPAGGPVPVSGLNDATAMIVTDLANWFNPYVPDLQFAHNEVKSAVAAFGSTAVLNGYMDLKADHADGKVRALSVKAFYGYCRQSQNRKPFGDRPNAKVAAGQAELERVNAMIAEARQ